MNIWIKCIIIIDTMANSGLNFAYFNLKGTIVMSKWKEFMNSIDKDVRTGVAIALVVVLLFGSGNFLGGLYSKNKDVNADTPSAQTTEAPTAAPVTQPPATTLPPATEAPTAAPSADTPTDTPAAPTDAPAAPAAPTGAPTAPADILKLFNESANKVKTNATKVVRNYEDLRHDEQHLQLPSALQSIGSGLISSFLKKNETPVEYTTKEDIIANFPVAGESYVSQATEADIAEATCTDDGTNYNITLKFKESVDPAQGTGAASAFNTIKADDVYNNAKVVTNFSAKYYDATINCKIDKATGNMIAATYTLPIILNVTAKVVVSLDAQVGMTFEHDYTITY